MASASAWALQESMPVGVAPCSSSIASSGSCSRGLPRLRLGDCSKVPPGAASAAFARSEKLRLLERVGADELDAIDAVDSSSGVIFRGRPGPRFAGGVSTARLPLTLAGGLSAKTAAPCERLPRFGWASGSCDSPSALLAAFVWTSLGSAAAGKDSRELRRDAAEPEF
jgi:hypothetical protein